MTQVVLIHLPEVPWLCLVREAGAQKLPALLSLIEGGMSGVVPAVGPAPLADGVIMTGFGPEQNGLLTRQAARPDGYGVDIADAMTLKKPTLWELLDSAGLRTAAVNMRTTNFGHLDHGTVVSDLFCEIRARRFREWGVPPGAVYPLEQAALLADLRLHPEDLAAGQLAPFFSRQPDVAAVDEQLRLVARVLCENSNAHSAATHILEHADPEFIAVRYPALEQLRPCFSAPDPDHPDGAPTWVFIELIDAFVARLLELARDDATIFLTGGSEQQPFWIARGAGIARDLLFPNGTRLYDLFPTLLALYGIQAPEGAPGKVPEGMFAANRFYRHSAPCEVKPAAAPLASADLLIREMRLSGREVEPASRMHLESTRKLSFRRRFMRGENARYEGRMLEAVAAFSDALKIIPDDTTTIHRLCTSLLSLARVSEARSHFSAIPEGLREQNSLRRLEAKIMLAENKEFRGVLGPVNTGLTLNPYCTNS